MMQHIARISRTCIPGSHPRFLARVMRVSGTQISTTKLAYTSAIALLGGTATATVRASSDERTLMSSPASGSTRTSSAGVTIAEWG
jgi:hypothetical protein